MQVWFVSLCKLQLIAAFCVVVVVVVLVIVCMYIHLSVCVCAMCMVCVYVCGGLWWYMHIFASAHLYQVWP